MSVVFCACTEGLENITYSVAENVGLFQPFVWPLQPSNEQRADPLLLFSLKDFYSRAGFVSKRPSCNAKVSPILTV